MRGNEVIRRLRQAGSVMATLVVVLGSAAVAYGLSPEEERLQEAVTPARAQEEKPQFSFATDILSQYIFRGVAFSRTGLVIQPSFTASYNGLLLNIWGNFDVKERNPYGRVAVNKGKAAWNETDFTISYSREVLPHLTLTVGGIYYLLSHNTSEYDSIEVYGGVAYKFPWFEVGFAAYREVNRLPGTYLQWYVSRSLELPFAGASLDLYLGWSAELSNDKFAFPVPDKNIYYHSLHAGQLMATLNVPLGQYVKVAPKIIYWYALGGHATKVISGLSWDGRHNHLLGGVTLTVSF